MVANEVICNLEGFQIWVASYVSRYKVANSSKQLSAKQRLQSKKNAVFSTSIMLQTLNLILVKIIRPNGSNQTRSKALPISGAKEKDCLKIAGFRLFLRSRRERCVIFRNQPEGVWLGLEFFLQIWQGGLFFLRKSLKLDNKMKANKESGLELLTCHVSSILRYWRSSLEESGTFRWMWWLLLIRRNIFRHYGIHCYQARYVTIVMNGFQSTIIWCLSVWLFFVLSSVLNTWTANKLFN